MRAIPAIVIVIFCVGLSKADESLDRALKESAKYSDYTTAAYDKEKACKILLDYVETNQKTLHAVTKCKIWATLAGLNSIWARGDSRDPVAARDFYARAIESLPEHLNTDVLTARVNLVSLIPSPRVKLRETARLCAFLANYQLWMDTLLEDEMKALEERLEPAEVEREGLDP